MCFFKNPKQPIWAPAESRELQSWHGAHLTGGMSPSLLSLVSLEAWQRLAELQMVRFIGGAELGPRREGCSHTGRKEKRPKGRWACPAPAHVSCT